MRRALSAAFLLGSLVLVLTGCGTGGLSEGGNTTAGQKLFVDNCGSCHTLANAGTKGTIGPNLDAAFAVVQEKEYPDSTVREVVAKQIKYPNTEPSTGAIGMPANIVTGDDVDDVAAYVTCVAGSTKAELDDRGCPAPANAGGAGGGGGGGETDGKAIFSSAGCESCHTLKAAGSTGTIGPNLDESTIDEAGAIAQVENGGGVMPAFKNDLSEAQIKAVAHFVVTSR